MLTVLPPTCIKPISIAAYTPVHPTPANHASPTIINQRFIFIPKQSTNLKFSILAWPFHSSRVTCNITVKHRSYRKSSFGKYKYVSSRAEVGVDMTSDIPRDCRGVCDAAADSLLMLGSGVVGESPMKNLGAVDLATGA